MKKFRNLLMVAVLSFALCSAKVFAKDKVKVYVFEAGGCPYCEAQMEYLKGLDSYGKKFEVITKELYVDHVDWEEGKDYELGVNVAVAFQEKGFANASYQGTPFVVISDIYAAASYSQSLEDVINTAYEEGDKDIVGCFVKGDDCADKIRENKETTTTTDEPTEKEEKKNNGITAVIVTILIVGIGAALIVFARGKNKVEEIPEKKADKKLEVKVEEKEVKKPVAKKTTTKTTAKKPATKKTTAKKPAAKKTTKK